MIGLVKFDKQSFVWSDSLETSELMNEPEAIAHGVWKYKIKKDEIKYAISLITEINNCIFFDDVLKLICDVGYKGEKNVR